MFLGRVQAKKNNSRRWKQFPATLRQKHPVCVAVVCSKFQLNRLQIECMFEEWEIIENEITKSPNKWARMLSWSLICDYETFRCFSDFFKPCNIFYKISVMLSEFYGSFTDLNNFLHLKTLPIRPEICSSTRYIASYAIKAAEFSLLATQNSKQT